MNLELFFNLGFGISDLGYIIFILLFKVEIYSIL